MVARDELTTLATGFAPEIARDPRPAPVLRVGAMGHRDIAIDRAAQVSDAVGHVLAAIRDAAAAAVADRSIAARFSGALDLVVISPLAQGADQIIAAAGEKTGYRLGAILPFPLADYEQTFDLEGHEGDIARLREFMAAAGLPLGYGVLVMDGDPSPKKRDSAFLAAGAQITHWSDFLIALLSETRGDSQTGTGVQQAIDTGMPVILIDPKRDKYCLFLDGVRVADADCDARLKGAVRTFFEAPPAQHGAHGAIDLPQYRAERILCDTSRPIDFEYRGPYRARTAAPFWARWCSGLNRGVEWLLRRKSAAHAAPGEPAPTAADLPFGPHQATPFVRLFLHLHRADVLAGAYAELYRSAHLLIAALGVATVTLGSVSAVLGVWPPLFSGFEFICLVYALTLVWTSNRQAWLMRWTHYRLLAEIYRYAKFLLVAGLPSPFGDTAVTRQVWTRDHTERVLRTYGLAVPGRGREPDAEAVNIARRYIVGQCVDDQMRFHRATVPARLRMAKFLRQASFVLSAASVIVLGMKFIAEVLLETHQHLFNPHILEPVLTLGEVLAIVLPALTAAVLALRAYGEHDVVAKRSAAMIEALERERKRVASAGNLDALGMATLRVVRTLLSEVAGWVDLFVDKHLEA